MMEGLTIIATNMGIDIGVLLLIIVNMVGLLFFAKSFMFGVVMEFFTTGIIFMLNYSQEWNWAPSVIVMFIWLVVMALSFFFIRNSNTAERVV